MKMQDARPVVICEECGKKLPEIIWIPTEAILLCHECYVWLKKHQTVSHWQQLKGLKKLTSETK